MLRIKIMLFVQDVTNDSEKCTITNIYTRACKNYFIPNKHCKEQAATLRMARDYGCDECAAEHEQLAEWLEELQQRRGRATDLAALESLRKQINETGRVRGISGTITQSVRPCVASGVRAAIQTLIDLTNKEIIAREEGGADDGRFD